MTRCLCGVCQRPMTVFQAIVARNNQKLLYKPAAVPASAFQFEMFDPKAAHQNCVSPLMAGIAAFRLLLPRWTVVSAFSHSYKHRYYELLLESIDHAQFSR